MQVKSKMLQLEGLKKQLCSRLFDYLSGYRKITPGRNFPCINPAHPDKNPSMGVVPGNPELCHCFGCKTTADIFTAAHFLESKPLRGPGFLADNMFYLAKKYGIDVPVLELTEQEQREMDTYRAYATAAQIVQTSLAQPLVTEKLVSYGWSLQTQQTLGVGTVESFEWYLNEMVNVYGFDRTFLESIDLDNPKIFGDHCLIYVVKDEHGQPVGFASRNLAFDAQKDWHDQMIADYGKDSEEARAAAPDIAKFVNTSARCPIYEKGKRLYGLHVARNNTPPLWIFEGYADGVTAHNAGMHNACAIGATAFTVKHLEMLLSIQVNHFVFVLDGDQAGAKGTERMVTMIEELFGDRIGLKVEIVIIPQGEDDPDKFIRKHGLAAFLALERIDVFSWKLHYAIQNGEDPDHLFETTVGLIVNEPHHLKQFRMCQQLARATGIPESVVTGEVDRRKDIEGQKRKGEMLVIAQSTVQALQKSPDRLPEILSQTQERVERVSIAKSKADTKALIDYYNNLVNQSRQNVDLGGLMTGYPIFDARFGGIPKAEAFITFPGKANHGKSSVGANMVGRIADRYDNVVFLIHTIDDSLRKFYTRILSARFDIPSWYFEYAGYHIQNRTKLQTTCEDGSKDTVLFADIVEESEKWLREHMVHERILPFDVSQMPNTVDTLEWKIKELRKQFPSSPLIAFCDNFHKYEMPGEGSESDVRSVSNRMKNLTTLHQMTLMATMELPKSTLAPGVRPRGDNTKGSGGILYDSSANINVYNEKKDLREDKAVLMWDMMLDTPEEEVPGQVVWSKKQPVLELIFDKSKIFKGFDGEIYYEMNEMTGRLNECDVTSQERWRKKAVQAEEERRERKTGRGGYGGGGYGQPQPHYASVASRF